MNNIKGVIFDWAGTMVDYGSIAPVMAFVELFKQKEIVVTAANVRIGMGLDKKEHTRVIMSQPDVVRQWLYTFDREPNDDDIDIMYSEVENILIEVVKSYGEPIKGAVEIINELKSMGIKIGSGTGYKDNMMESLAPVAANNGIIPDCIVSSSNVPAGRPYPWMCYLNAIKLGIYPLDRMVKVGDTIADIEEAKNAGMWSIGLTLSGNEIGLTESEQNELSVNELNLMVHSATNRFYEAGAHYVIDGIWDCMPIFQEIDERMGNGEKP